MGVNGRYITVTGWKWDQFSNFLLREELKKIASYSLCADPYLEDTLYWNGTAHGKFSIKSALVLTKSTHEPPETNPVQWRLIWKLPVQQRIRMFIWLAGHDRLMSNYNRVRRGLSDDPLCPRCLAEDETTDHLLRHCPVSRAIWSGLGEGAVLDSFYTIPFASWISNNASNGSALVLSSWSMKFAITCWWLWRWRNNLVFDRAEDNPIEPIHFLRHQFEISRQALDPFALFLPTPGTSHQERYIRWSPPPHDWFLLNTDGASKGNPGSAGCGGIVRDESGNFVEAYSFSCGSSTSMRAEMNALLIGLERAKHLGLKKLIVHMDNLTCVTFIRDDQLLSNSLRQLVLRCKALISSNDWTVKIDHVYREANRAADWLANVGVSLPTSITYFDAPPEGLRSILREDILGVAFPRLVSS